MPHAIGDASAWGSYFTAHGHAPNRQPAPGAIAWESGGDHVAYVESVSPDRSHVTISEYNEAYYPGQPTTGDGLYDTRTVPVGSFEYIHVKDLTSGLLDFIKTRNTGSGKVELFEIPPPYTEQPTVATPTWFSPADANNGWFQMDGSTLVFIKTRNTGSGKVELFEIPPPYTEQPTVATPTWFSPADANNGWFQMDGK